MEFTSWHGYPKVYALGHNAIKDLLLDDVIVEEKIDGSQFSTGVFNNELKARSKGKQIIIDNPEKMFSKAIETIIELKPLLHNGWTYRCEYLQKPHHNTLNYSRVPNKHIILFDINTGEEKYVSYEEKKKEAERIGLEVVPLLFNGKLSETNKFIELLETESILGGVKIEGCIIKNYNRFGLDGKVLMGKYVSEKYKEVHDKEWRKANSQSKDIIQNLILSLKTEARWEKAIQHLRDGGTLTDSPKDIGELIKEVQKDMIEEYEEYIKETLYKYAKSKITRGIIAGLPEWYKEKLMNRQFEE